MGQLDREFEFDQIYDALRGLANQRVQQGLAGTSLQATGLVHEVWLKLSEMSSGGLQDASHFYATAAQAMRWILVDRARRRQSMRASDGDAVPIEEMSDREQGDRDRETLALDIALERLRSVHPRKAEIVMHRHFAGLSVEETAEALGISTATVKREWRFARVWLLRELAEESEES